MGTPELDFDIDVPCMTKQELQQELLAARKAIRTFLLASGHDLCQENRWDMAQVLPDKERFRHYKPEVLPWSKFMSGCVLYRMSLEGGECPHAGGGGPLDALIRRLANADNCDVPNSGGHHESTPASRASDRKDDEAAGRET